MQYSRICRLAVSVLVKAKAQQIKASFLIFRMLQNAYFISIMIISRAWPPLKMKLISIRYALAASIKDGDFQIADK